MKVLNLNAENLLGLDVKDVLTITNTLLSQFGKRETIFVNSAIVTTNDDLNAVVTYLAQIWDKEGTQIKVKGEYNRAIDWSCSQTGKQPVCLSDDNFTFELKFQKRFKELTK